MISCVWDSAQHCWHGLLIDHPFAKKNYIICSTKWHGHWLQKNRASNFSPGHEQWCIAFWVIKKCVENTSCPSPIHENYISCSTKLTWALTKKTYALILEQSTTITTLNKRNHSSLSKAQPFLHEQSTPTLISEQEQTISSLSKHSNPSNLRWKSYRSSLFESQVRFVLHFA